MNDIINLRWRVGATDPAQMVDYYASTPRRMATERRAGSSIPVRNGVMSVSDQPDPRQPVRGDHPRRGAAQHVLRLGAFNLQRPSTCRFATPFSIRSDDQMAPHLIRPRPAVFPAAGGTLHRVPCQTSSVWPYRDWESRSNRRRC